MTPLDELLVKLRAYRSVNEWGDPVRHEILDQAADALEAAARENERLVERWRMIDELRSGEGHSVEIIHDNADFGGSNCAIYVSTDYSVTHTTFYGDTVDDCLKQAVAARNALSGGPHE